MIVSLLLESVRGLRLNQESLHHQREERETALIALQTGQTRLNLNGIEVEVQRSEEGVRIQSEGKEILHVLKK
ncbi:competence system putative prepilin ComGE [Streptococcus sp. DD13]|uniref:competence system putative prepilin ComGE n=1 Tax=Streptococcus sp. DD13 TaxID=1777881 RepID=UPI000A5371E0|nr:competence system putative prepilin ComGE [Streptococcus sp. DD13]